MRIQKNKWQLLVYQIKLFPRIDIAITIQTTQTTVIQAIETFLDRL